MPTTVAEARKAHTKAFFQSLRDNDCITPLEADDRLNDSSRELITAMQREQDEPVWLGNINLHGKDRTVEKGGEGNDPMWWWDGSLVYNFGCAFVVPCDDEQLRQMILDRDRAEYTGTKDDMVRVEAIHARIEELGGHHLVWS